jgi:hypothetical protein
MEEKKALNYRIRRKLDDGAIKLKLHTILYQSHSAPLLYPIAY